MVQEGPLGRRGAIRERVKRDGARGAIRERVKISHDAFIRISNFPEAMEPHCKSWSLNIT